MNFLFEVFGKYDLQILLTKYNITGLCSPRRFRLFACTRISCVSFSFFFFTFIVYFSFFLFFACLCVLCLLPPWRSKVYTFRTTSLEFYGKLILICGCVVDVGVSLSAKWTLHPTVVTV